LFVVVVLSFFFVGFADDVLLYPLLFLGEFGLALAVADFGEVAAGPVGG
jgi:hypothetical protein